MHTLLLSSYFPLTKCIIFSTPFGKRLPHFFKTRIARITRIFLNTNYTNCTNWEFVKKELRRWLYSEKNSSIRSIRGQYIFVPFARDSIEQFVSFVFYKSVQSAQSVVNIFSCHSREIPSSNSCHSCHSCSINLFNPLNLWSIFFRAIRARFHRAIRAIRAIRVQKL